MNGFVNELTRRLYTNPVFIIFIIISIISFVFYKEIVGWFGEYWTKKALKKLPKDKYKILNNLLIFVNNKSHQIDHVVVSSYGIFCIETKQYNGYIVGDKYDKYWIRKAGKKRYYYTNPIRQNYGHCKALSELLHIEESKIINIVCISSNAKLNIKHDGEVVNYYTTVNKIKAYKDEIINNPKEITEIILNNNRKDKKSKKEHIKSINKIVDKSVCPKCGGKLINRSGKYGAFIGCSNYPKCNYTQKGRE